MTVATPKSPHSTTDLAGLATEHPSEAVVVASTDVETAEQACVAYQVDAGIGLDAGEASARLGRFGPNRLTDPPRRAPWRRFIDQFRSVLVAILAGAAGLAAALGDLKDAVVVGVVLLINAVLGYVQEGRAESAMTALRQMLVARCRVRRDGAVIEIPSENLVPGDIVLLEAGDRVPADGRFLTAISVSVDESSRTGESEPVDKTAEPVFNTGSALGDRRNRGYMNTVVTRGRAELLVTDTGMATEMGRVAGLMNEAEPGQTPLQKQLDQLGKRLAALAGVANTDDLRRARPRLGEVPFDSAAKYMATFHRDGSDVVCLVKGAPDVVLGRSSHRAGVAVKMITGDHPTTAAAIAHDVGIVGRVITGADLDTMTDDELDAEIESIGVCARVSPEHKVRVVHALKRNDHIVAMTGDGVNDAAALRHADIGIAMGITGTAVTKEAADMVLADDNFATIVGAVEQGRAIYDNIVKFVRFQLTTNLGAIGTLLGASLLGLPAPLSAVQVLFINIIADGPPAMTLGVDPAAAGTMQRGPRRPGAPILDRTRIRRLFSPAAVMVAGTLGLLIIARNIWGEPVALTMAFTTFVFFQLANVFNARTEYASIWSRETFTNNKLWIAVGAVAATQVAVVSVGPLQSLFETTPLTVNQWLVCVLVATTVIGVEEARKAYGRRVHSIRSIHQSDIESSTGRPIPC